LNDLLEFIERTKKGGKRPTFDIDFLAEWLAYLNGRAFLHKYIKDGEIKGVITMFPIGKHKRTPSMQFVIECMQLYVGGQTDYFIMDALTEDEESRKMLVKRLLNIYPTLESDDSQIYAQRGDSIVKFNKKLLITLTK
jgi:hypothetical protein